MLKKATVWC